MASFIPPTPAYPATPTTAGLLFGAWRTTGNEPHAHKGIDLAWGHAGTPVVAAAPGTVVVAATTTVYGGPGIVEIDHGDGWRTRYLHLTDGETVAKGQAVNAGDMLGTTAPLASGPHLHFEVLQDGVAVDPKTVLGAAAIGGGILIAAALAGLAYWYWRKR